MTTCTTPTNEYEALRSKINEMFPERLKLEFGCEVERFGKTTTVYAYFDALNAVRCVDGTKGDGFPVSGIGEILGKPLTVADVLRALDRSKEGGLCSMYTDGSLHGADDELLGTFTLSLPLSAPENAAACKAVTRLLADSK